METFDTIGTCFTKRNIEVSPVKLYHVKIVKRMDGIVLHEYMLCELHWNACKGESYMQNDRAYKVNVVETTAEAKRQCDECREQIERKK